MKATQQVQARATRAPDSNTSLPRDVSNGTGAAPQRLLPERSSGWDPYEVWRTRVRAASDPAHPGWEARR